MPNVIGGRTYMIASTVLNPDIESGKRRPSSRLYAAAKDYIDIETPYVVPNGKWVLERPSGATRLVGASQDEVDYVLIDTRYGQQRALYVSDQPFGFIVRDSAFPVASIGRERLFSAQQIHKGELGQTVPTRSLSYVRQAFEDGTKGNVTKSRERRRSNLGWVRLTDLMSATNLSSHELLLGFWQFSGHLAYEDGQVCGTLLDIVEASLPDEIEGRVPSVRSITRQEAEVLVGKSADNMWVRRGFAFTTLRLLALGEKPKVMQTA